MSFKKILTWIINIMFLAVALFNFVVAFSSLHNMDASLLIYLGLFGLTAWFVNCIPSISKSIVESRLFKGLHNVF